MKKLRVQTWMRKFSECVLSVTCVFSPNRVLPDKNCIWTVVLAIRVHKMFCKVILNACCKRFWCYWYWMRENSIWWEKFSWKSTFIRKLSVDIVFIRIVSNLKCGLHFKTKARGKSRSRDIFRWMEVRLYRRDPLAIIEFQPSRRIYLRVLSPCTECIAQSWLCCILGTVIAPGV